MFRLDDPPVPIDVLMPSWFGIWEKHRAVIALILERFGNEYLTPELRFLSAVQAAEGLHRDLPFVQTARDETDHKKMIERIKRNLLGDEQQWVLERLRNEPSLARRLTDLCSPLQHEPLGLILGQHKLQQFVGFVAATRNYLAHRLPPGDRRVWTEPGHLVVLAEAVALVVQLHILNLLGIPFQDQWDLLHETSTFRFATRNYQPTLNLRGDFP